MALIVPTAAFAFRLCALIAVTGCGYLLLAAVVARRRLVAPTVPESSGLPVTILKPLHGAEPGLERRLLSFCEQSYEGEFQVVCGCQDRDDPAIDAVEQVSVLRPPCTIDLVVDQRLHGGNRKVSNLLHCYSQAKHDIIVLADSDIEVEPTYLAELVDALEKPGVGAVTCLYEGEGIGLGALLSAQAINAHFLPNVVFGSAIGAATPCCGSTIALRRDILERIGGFASLLDRLADDYAIGEAVRALGLSVAVMPFTVKHFCGETSVGAFFKHQLRFARTIRSIDPAGHAGSFITNPLPFAVVAALAQVPYAPWLVAACVACRVVLLVTIARRFKMTSQHLWLTPICDLGLFAIFVASFCGSTVEWRGERFRSLPDGTLAPEKELNLA